MKLFIYRLFYFSYGIHRKLIRRVSVSGVLILLLAIASAVTGSSNESMNYQVVTFLLSIITIAIVYSLFFRYRFSANRYLPRFATAGVKLNYKIVIHNKSDKIQQGLKLFENWADPRPNFQDFLATSTTVKIRQRSLNQAFGYDRWLWLIARQQCGVALPIKLPALAPHSKTEIIGEIIPTHRGMMRLTGMTVARPDPFGLFNACKTIFLPQSLLILPKLYQLPPIQLPGVKKHQSGGVALASSVGDSEEFRSLRDYRPGDPLRKIHWKSWAKVGKPIVKEEQDEFFVRHALILDTFQSVNYSEILESAISIAASLACEVQTQESLLDLMFVGHEAYCFTFGRGLSHTDKMLEILASVVACQDKSFDSIIPVVLEKLSLLSGCICIFLCWDEDRKRLVNYLKTMGIHTLVLVVTNQAGELDNSDLASMNDQLATFHVLTLGNIQEELMHL
ncbi:DUF58 domain-containing protein [Tolypothrix sp. PCC 7910]|uniref:DUF58 domain-containing protein n=1 Tax=Tolypothrix sp. PCC 7910 TaxID=2099387 RepID=UPI001427979A|nr:DUF58 domain-containing protein [Tolypothrix sp. PCC 7910]QIR36747.1 DUF58 domain-containing protein [Tolypothrix sp. PCC 7910]